MTGHTPWPAVINLGNSLIGVSILAMPFCFKECGLILGCVLLFLGSKLNKYSCHLLLRASKVARRNSYEMLAYHTLGSVGKLAVELCIICFLIACCVAYFIIMGDLGPAIISKWFELKNDDHLRAGFLIFLAMFIILPLCQKRNLDSISNISVISIVFYLLFALDIIIDCIPTFLAGKWINTITYWNTSGLLRGISIFSAAFSCQTVLFAVYETIRERNPKVMEAVVSKSINLVWIVYFAVGFFGYVLYHDNGSPKGDILLDFQPCFMSEILRLGFSFSVALSFPLAVFPCRASIHTLFFSSSHSLENPHGGGPGGADYIPPGRFRFITVLIVVGTLILGITIPNVETMLGINGAVMGNLTCFIFPALIVLKTQNLPEKNYAKALLFIGIFLMTSATYNNLQKAMETNTAIKPYKDKAVNLPEDNFNMLEEKKRLEDDNGLDMLGHRIDEAGKMVEGLKDKDPETDLKEGKEAKKADDDDCAADAGYAQSSRSVSPLLQLEIVVGPKDNMQEGIDARRADSRKHSNERQEPVVPHAPMESKEVVLDERDAAEEKEEVIDEDGREDERGPERPEEEDEREREEEKEDEEIDKREVKGPEDRELNKEDEVKEDQRGIEEEKEGVQDGAPKQEEEVGGDEVEEVRGEVEVVEKRDAGQEHGDEKRQKKDAKVIQKQSKKIKELEEMQRKHAEAIENQANALEFLLKKQQEEAEGVNQQPVGVVGEQQQQQGVLQNDQLAAQQLPGVPVVQNQQNQQPLLQNQLVLQNQQQPLLQDQQPILQNQQPILQNQQPVLQNQQPILQNQQPVLQNQQQVLQNQVVAQDQQLLLQNQQAVLQNDAAAAIQNQAILLQNQQQQPPLVRNQQPAVQQQPLIPNQLPILDLNVQLVPQNQPVIQNQQPILDPNQQLAPQNQQPIVAQQGVEYNQQQILQQQLLPQQGEGMVLQQDGGLAGQGGGVDPNMVIMQNNAAIIGQQQGNIPLQQQPIIQADARPVVQLNQQPVPGQLVPGQLVPGQQVPVQQVPGQQVPGQQVPGQGVPGQPLPVVQLQPQVGKQEPQQLAQEQHQVEVGGNIQANLEPIGLQLAQDHAIVENGLRLKAREDQQIPLDKRIGDLPDRIELGKRDVQVAAAMGMNQRALQSHQYEQGGEGGRDGEQGVDKVGAGDGESDGEVEKGVDDDGKGEGEEVKDREALKGSQDMDGGGIDVAIEEGAEKVIKEGRDILEPEGLDGEESKDEGEGKRKKHKTKHSKKEKGSQHKERELLENEDGDL